MSVDVKVVIDATKLLDGQPLALAEVFGRPWLVYYLRALRSAGLNDRAALLVPPAWEQRLRDVARAWGGDRIRVVSKALPADGLTVVPINAVFVPHVLVRRLRHAGDLTSAVICTIDTPADLRKAEEFLSRYERLVFSRLNMSAARAIALGLRGTRITPNQVSVAACLLGIAAAVAASIGTYQAGVAAAVLLQVALTLDLTDGYLARLTNRSTEFGNWLDTVFDEVYGFAIVLGVVAGTLKAHGPAWALPGAAWLLTFHVVTANHWLTRAYGLPAHASAFWIKDEVTGVKGVVLRAGRWLLWLSQGLDNKFHVISVALVLGVTPLLLVFMSLSNLAALVFMFAGRLALRDRSGSPPG